MDIIDVAQILASLRPFSGDSCQSREELVKGILLKV